MCSLNIIVVLIIFQGLRDQIWLLSFGVGFVKTRNLCRKICCGDLVMRSSLSSRRTDTWVSVLGRLLGLYIQYCLPFNRVWFIHEVNNVINNRVIGLHQKKKTIGSLGYGYIICCPFFFQPIFVIILEAPIASTNVLDLWRCTCRERFEWWVFFLNENGLHVSLRALLIQID